MRNTILATLLFVVVSLGAQNETAANKEVAREALVLEAGKEKILGRLDKAKELYKQLLIEYPNNDLAAYELARILMVQNQAEEAIIWASKAAAIDPANVWYAILKADALQAMGQFKDAAGVYEQLVKQNLRQSNYYYKWAFYLVKANELNAALKVYDELDRLSHHRFRRTRHVATETKAARGKRCADVPRAFSISHGLLDFGAVQTAAV